MYFLIAVALVKLGCCLTPLFAPYNKTIPSGRLIVALSDTRGERSRLLSHSQSSYLYENVICEPYNGYQNSRS